MVVSALVDKNSKPLKSKSDNSIYPVNDIEFLLVVSISYLL